jgi:hypothetical protein
MKRRDEMLDEESIEQLRTNYREVRRWWRDADEWSEADLAEADETINKAVKSGDEELIAPWMKWLEQKANEIRGFTEKVRAMEKRIREEEQTKKAEQHG